MANKYTRELKQLRNELVRKKLQKELAYLDANYKALVAFQNVEGLEQIQIPDYDKFGFAYSIDKKNGFILVHSP